MIRSIGRALIVVGAFGWSGCVFGVTKLDVAHSPLAGAPAKRDGTILVKNFVDARPPEQRQYIGNKRNGYRMVLGNLATKEGVELPTLLTGYFAEALRQAGYDARVEPATSDRGAAFDVVLDGEIRKFWLDLYMATWHNVDVSLTLRDPSGTQILWQRDIHGDETNVLWLGVSSEFEKVIRQALDKALDQAVADFAAAEFQDAVHHGRAAGPETISSTTRHDH